MTSGDDQARIHAIEVALEARWPETRIEPTLERISALVDHLGSPQLSYPTIHVGGTNGKTTTARMIDSLMAAHGLRTGRFTSPHLESFLERVAINGEPIEPKDFIFAYNDVAPYIDLMDQKFEHPISFFEAMTAIAFVAFAEWPVDIGVIEVGMGGEWDATNVVEAAVSVITPIGFDHTAYLGNTLTEIAKTKGGIIKPGSSVILARQEPEAAVELMRRVAEVEAIVAREGVEYSLESRAIAVGGQLISINGLGRRYDDIFLPLHGKHQGANAATALAAVEAFFGGEELVLESVQEGFAAVTSPGRCEIVHSDPTVILDAAHNPHGAKAIAETLETEFTFDEIIGIFAAFADKDVEGILTELEPVLSSIIVTASESSRAMPVGEVDRIATRIFGADRVVKVDHLEEAIKRAITDARRPLSDDSIGIVITGSVVTVGQARAILKRLSRD
ncbi:MAG TPA: folylpolyglutamate synthase/dihydrofolate synthase family protein [Candidatus Paceibacterota bacterium]|nr:folylpolyglutamate synthase/dihydrofolate synthase family protein [Candidatus Paceibacterota bacterium]